MEAAVDTPSKSIAAPGEPPSRYSVRKPGLNEGALIYIIASLSVAIVAYICQTDEPIDLGEYRRQGPSGRKSLPCLLCGI